MAKKKKKSKLKKLAKVLGAGLAIAGLGRAFANRNREASIANIEAKEAGFDIPLVKDTPEENTFKVQDVKVNVPTNNNTFRTRHRITDSAGNTIPNIKKQSYVARHSAPKNVMGPFDYMQPAPALKAGNLRGFTGGLKDGGRVKKRTGAAKRGFGRAFKGGKR